MTCEWERVSLSLVLDCWFSDVSTNNSNMSQQTSAVQQLNMVRTINDVK